MASGKRLASDRSIQATCETLSLAECSAGMLLVLAGSLALCLKTGLSLWHCRVCLSHFLNCACVWFFDRRLLPFTPGVSVARLSLGIHF